MTIAVSFQNLLCWIALTVFTMKCCSSIGLEYPAWPSWNAGAFRNVTDGRLPALSAAKKSSESYWWLAGSGVWVFGIVLNPIDATLCGRAWVALRVEA